MTRVLDGKALIRETAVYERDRPIVAELHARYLVLRLKGERKEHLMPWDKLLWIAYHREAEQHMHERANPRRRPAGMIHANH